MSASEQTLPKHPRVFISYSHDSAAHCDRVLALAQQLRRDGIDAELDQFHQDELLHWPRWCEERMRPQNSDFVVCVCTPEYKRRVEGGAAADVGKGVFWEGTLIYNYLYDEKGNRRCIPVLMPDGEEADIPRILTGYTRFGLSSFDLADTRSGYAGLYRLLTGQPSAPPGELGDPKKLPPLEEKERQTDFVKLTEQVLAAIRDVRSDTIEILAILKDRPVPTSTAQRPHNLPPWMASKYFIGREEELRSLYDAVSAPGRVFPQIIQGTGGIGKTRLAVQVVWLLYVEEKCDTAFYVSASSPDELATQLAALDVPSLLDLYSGAEPPRELDVRRQKVIDALRKKIGRWVLLLDAADSKEARDAVKGLLKDLAGGRFIVTSRRADWPKGTVQQLPLNLFTADEARACLRSRYWKREPSDEELAGFERVARELGCLPLALAIAASYMESRSITPERYLQEWGQKRDALLDFLAEDLDYDRSLIAAFRVSYDRLSAPAAALIRCLAWLAPEPFPRKLVEESGVLQGVSSGLEGLAELAEELGGSVLAVSDAAFLEALAELRALSLVGLADKLLWLHKLVLECARAIMSEEERRASFSSASTWVRSQLPDVEYDEAGWELWVRLSPHLDAIVATGKALHIEGRSLAFICGAYGVWLFEQARFGPAESLTLRALEINEKRYGPAHPNVADELNNLGELYANQGQYARAEPFQRRALAIREQALGPDHPKVAQSLSNLAGSFLQTMNRVVEAELLLRRALGMERRATGQTSPTSRQRPQQPFAELFRRTNRPVEAEPFYRRALAIDENSFGPNQSQRRERPQQPCPAAPRGQPTG